MVLGKQKYFTISVKYTMLYVYNNDSLTMCELCFDNVISWCSDMYTLHLHFHLDVWYWEIINNFMFIIISR